MFGKSEIASESKLPARNVLRVSPAGVYDPTFDPGKGADNYVTAIVPLADGGALVGGMFDLFNGQSHEHIVRLNSTGTIEDNATFASGLSFDGSVLTMATQTIGAGTPSQPQFVVGGIFSFVNGVQHAHLVRLNYDGTIDASFNPVFDDRVTVVTTQADGKILVGGDFISVNGQDRRHIVRLNYDGTIDGSFAARVVLRPTDFVNPAAVYVIRLLDDGSMYVGGNFSEVNGVTRNYLARLDANGVLDTVFDPGKAIINAVQSLTVLDGSLLVGETLSKRPTGKGLYPASLIRLVTELSTVGLTASKPTAFISTRSIGAFRLTRTSPVASTILTKVYFQLSGTAVLDTDYKLPAKLIADDAPNGLYHVVFAPGKTKLSLEITPKKKATAGRMVTLTVIDNPDRVVYAGAGQSATVTIED